MDVMYESSGGKGFNLPFPTGQSIPSSASMTHTHTHTLTHTQLHKVFNVHTVDVFMSPSLCLIFVSSLTF